MKRELRLTKKDNEKMAGNLNHFSKMWKQGDIDSHIKKEQKIHRAEGGKNKNGKSN